MLLELAAALRRHGRAEVGIFSLSGAESRRYAKFGKLIAPFILSSKKWDFSDFDIVHANGWASEAAFAKAPAEKTLVTLYGTIAQYLQNVPVPPWMRAYNALTQLRCERRACRQARFLASLCRRQSEEMALHYGCERGKVRAIDCGIDTRHFVPKGKAESRERLGVRAKGKVVLACGRMSVAHKGFDILLRLASRLGKGDLLIVNGSVPDNLRAAMPANMVARTTGWDSMPFLYSAADLFVHPSRYEGFGLATAEAMACGTPAVAFDTGAAADLIGKDEGGALISRVSDGEGFISAALSLLGSEREAKARGRAAAGRASKYTVERMAEGYLAYYRRIAQGR
jgi:D-inositol-3-phosphate glycosyltransferase